MAQFRMKRDPVEKGRTYPNTSFLCSEDRNIFAESTLGLIWTIIFRNDQTFSEGRRLLETEGSDSAIIRRQCGTGLGKETFANESLTNMMRVVFFHAIELIISEIIAKAVAATALSSSPAPQLPLPLIVTDIPAIYLPCRP